MATAVPSTPQRPLPGAFMNTPAPKQFSSMQNSIFNRPANTPSAQPSQNPFSQQVATTSSTTTPSSAPRLSQIERAARTINSTLDEESRYPPLDNYISQGFSSDYDIPNSPAWAPFQKIKMYEIPDRILEQFNQAQVSTMMGLFAEFNHAWISIDNALYLWDYTHPNPEIIGFEEQPHTITAVKLAYPKPGVFVDSISRVLVVATSSDIFLLGFQSQSLPGGAKSVSLYQTRMQVSVRGLGVTCIAGSAKTGRIFFSGRSDDDVYELTYQQEEKWFQPRCSRVNHTKKGFMDSVVPSLPFSQKSASEYVSQIVIDASRNTLYTLSSRSTIRIFDMGDRNGLSLSLVRTLGAIKNDLSHRVPQSSVLAENNTIVSIQPISSQEASQINLTATMSNGCRIFFSAVTSTYYMGSSNTSPSAPTSMQVRHIKFPPSDSSQNQQPAPPGQAQIVAAKPGEQGDISKVLTPTRTSERFPPGYFLCFVQKDEQAARDTLFMCAPDSARIAHPQDPAQTNKFPEFGVWFTLDSRAEDVGLITAPFAASSNPQGFGNELAIQYDLPASEVAVLTNAGVYTFRRRRLCDVFASAIRYGGGEDGLEGEIRNFVRLYGRGEVIATALAVACGQSSDVTHDARVARITDPETLEFARKTFIDHGGKPVLNENFVVDQGVNAIENVRPSPRHEGLALYVSRILRSVWKAAILREVVTPQGGLQVTPTVALPKLHEIQRDLTRLQEFLTANRSMIEGLAGPEALGRVSTKQEEIALQGEHRALDSLMRLVSDVVEGISFVLVLFDERVTEIILSIGDQARQQMRQMTYERLFCTSEGKELAKELVKAIVNRNIAAGSNVDTVTDALRRRCGSFCSADDCIIFKAQEQLKRASDTSSSSELSRNLLNESLRLLQRVAASLSMEQLKWAVEQYAALQFFAGAIQLCLSVAQEQDRGNSALAYLNDGAQGGDPRAAAYGNRKKCYELIHDIVNAVDRSAAQAPEMIDGQYTVTAKRKQEAYDTINDSQDEVFQIDLYDWYLSQGWSDRLLDVRSSFVISYLQRKSQEDVTHADLLWRYYAQYSNFLEAAQVQLQLAKSSFDLSLERRIEYLSRARANASTKTIGRTEIGRSRQSRQELIREVADLLDIANIQEDLLQRIKSDVRLTADRRPAVVKQLSGAILPIDDLYNGFADQAGYYDLCLLIYHVADYRNPTDVRSTWQNLIEQLHLVAVETGEPIPYEAVSERVRSTGTRLALSDAIFPVGTLVPLLERYSVELQKGVAPAHWVIDIFLDLGVPFDAVFAALEGLFYSSEEPFSSGKKANRGVIASDLLSVVARWFQDSAQLGGRAFGSDENAAVVSETLRIVLEAGVLRPAETEEARVLRQRVERSLR